MRLRVLTSVGVAVSLCAPVTFTATAQANQVAPKNGAWRVLRTANDLTGAQDARLVLRSLEWAPPPKRPVKDKRHGSTLVLVCGDRILNTNGRSLLFFPGEAFAMFGSFPQAIVDYRFSADGPWVNMDPYAYDYRDVFLYENDWRSEEWVTFLADAKDAYFSDSLFGSLRSADTLFIRYTGSRNKTVVTFVLAGLDQVLLEVPECGFQAK